MLPLSQLVGPVLHILLELNARHPLNDVHNIRSIKKVIPSINSAQMNLLIEKAALPRAILASKFLAYFLNEVESPTFGLIVSLNKLFMA